MEIEIFIGKQLIYEDRKGERHRIIVTGAYDNCFRFTKEGKSKERLAILDDTGKWTALGSFYEYTPFVDLRSKEERNYKLDDF